MTPLGEKLECSSKLFVTANIRRWPPRLGSLRSLRFEAGGAPDNDKVKQRQLRQLRLCDRGPTHAYPHAYARVTSLWKTL
jgi:hypothetical protein